MSESPRYNWPILLWNADWQSWQQKFEDLTNDIDSDVFSNMEGSKCIFNQLPNARVYDDSGTYKLEMLSDLILISRTYNMKITVDSTDDLVLIPYHLVGLTFTPGAVGEVTTEFELFNTAPIDNDVHIFGYVTENYSINWFNGSVFAEGESARRLFSFLAATGADTHKVKVSASDTTEDFLKNKLTAGTNITLNILNPGGDEEIEIVAAGAGTTYWSRNASSPAFLYPSTDTDTIRIGDGTVGRPGIASKTHTNTGIRWDVTESESSIYFVGEGYDIASMYIKDYEQILSFVDTEDYDTAILRKKMSPGYAGDAVIFKIEAEAGVNATNSQLILNSITTDDVSSSQSAIIDIESISSGLHATSSLKATTDVTATSGIASVQMIAEGYHNVDCLIRAHDLVAHSSSIVILSDGGSSSSVSIKAEGSVTSTVEIGTDPSTGYAYTDVFAVSADALSSLEILSQSGGGGGVDAEIDIKALNNGANSNDDATIIVRSYAAAGYSSVVIGSGNTDDVILSVGDSIFFRFSNVDKLEFYHSTDTVVFSTFEPDDTLSVLEFSHKKYAGTSEAAIEFNVLGDTGTAGSRFTINSYNSDTTDKADIEIHADGGTPKIDIVATSTGSGLAEANLYADGNVTGDGEVDILATSTAADAFVYIAAEGSVNGIVYIGSTSTGIVAFTDLSLYAALHGTWTEDAVPLSTSPSEWSTYNTNFGEVSLLAALNVAYSRIGTLAASQVVFGNRSGSGGIEQTSSFTFNNQNQLLIGTGPDKIGSTANSLYVGGKLEVDNNAEFDGWIYSRAGIFLIDDIQINLGNAGNAKIVFDTTQTQDALMICADTSSETLIIADRSAVSPTPHDFAIPAMSDPTIAIMAADQTNTKGLLLSWDQIKGGNNVTVTGEKIIAMGNSLLLTGNMSNSLVMGSGSTVDADGSLVVGDSLNIGQGTGHSSPLGDKLLIVGDSLTIDASSGFFIGSTIDAESNYSSAVGTNLTVSHDYAMARGRYVTTMVNGARHWGMDRHNSVDGTAQGIDGLIQVGTTTGNNTTNLYNTFGGSGLSILLPDGVMAVFEIELISAIFAADSVSNGYRVCSRRIICWNNAGFMAYDFEVAPQSEIAHYNSTWTSTIGMTTSGNTGFNVRVTVTGLSVGTEVLTHVACVRGFTSQTSMIKSS